MKVVKHQSVFWKPTQANNNKCRCNVRVVGIGLLGMISVCFVAQTRRLASILSSRNDAQVLMAITAQTLESRYNSRTDNNDNSNILAQMLESRSDSSDNDKNEADSITLPLLPPPPKFKFYVYQIPTNMTAQSLTKCIEKAHQAESRCGWGLEVCTENATHIYSLRYRSRRLNSNADAVIADAFQHYPLPERYEYGDKHQSPAAASFAVRTTNPKEADAFIVPYPHSAHCKCVKFDTRCYGEDIQHQFFALKDSLKYYHQNKERHLFLTSMNWDYAHARFRRNKHIHTTLGLLHRPECLQHGNLCGHIVIPYLNTNDEYTPSALQNRNKWWWVERPRQYSVVGRYGKNSDNARSSFLDYLDQILGTDVGGSEIKVEFFRGKSARFRDFGLETDLLELYQNSTFCLILPGDLPAQKRFFDAILSGCIPVVFAYAQKPDGFSSWYDGHDSRVPKNESVRITYPFPRGFFLDNPSLGINYSSFVVEINVTDCMDKCTAASINGTCPNWIQYNCTKPHLEEIMSDNSRLYNLRQNLLKHATLFSYGLQEDSLKYYDAITVLLNQLGHYLRRLDLYGATM